MALRFLLIRKTAHYLQRRLLQVAAQLIYAAWFCVFAIMLAAAGLLWLDSKQGHEWLAQQISLLPTVKLQAIEGSLLQDPQFIGLHYEDADYRIEANQVQFAWQLRALLSGTIKIDYLKAQQLSIALKPARTQHPPQIPQAEFTLPFALEIKSVDIATLHLHPSDSKLANVHFSLASDGHIHTLSELRAQFNDIELNADLRLDGRAPFETAGHFLLHNLQDDYPFSIQGDITGSLRQLHVQALGDGAASGTQADLLLDTLATRPYQILHSGSLAFSGFNPAHWVGTWPKAKLNFKLSLHNAGKDEASGYISIQNHLSGTLNQQRLPFEQIESQLFLKQNALNLKQIQMRLNSAAIITGQSALTENEIKADLQLNELDAATIWQQNTHTRLTGPVHINSDWSAHALKLQLFDAIHQTQIGADLALDNANTKPSLTIKQLKLQHGEAYLTARGQGALQAPFDFQLDSTFYEFNPAKFADLPIGDINGQIRASGRFQNDLAIHLDYALRDSMFNQQKLSGVGKVDFSDAHLAHSDAWLALGNNRMEIKGSFGRAEDELKANFNFPLLSQLGAPVTGQAKGWLTLSGGTQTPVISLHTALTQLRYQNEVSIPNAQLDLNLPRDRQSAMQLDLVMNDAQLAGLALKQLRIHSEGSQAQHQIFLDVNAQQGERNISLQAALAGTLGASLHWIGRLNTLEAQLPQSLRLHAPLAMQISPQGFKTEGGHLSLGGIQIALGPQYWDTHTFTSSGQISQLALRDLLQWQEMDDMESDLLAKASWNLRYTESLNGKIEIQHDSGNYIWRNTSNTKTPLDLKQAAATLTLRNNDLDLNGQVIAEHYGSLNFNAKASLDLAAGGLVEKNPLTFKVEGDLPDLSTFNRFSPTGLQVAGRAHFNIQRQGNLSQGILSGQLEADQLFLNEPASGLNLHDGKFNIDLNNEGLFLKEAYFQGGKGDMRASGKMRYQRGELSADAHILANKLTLFSRSDLLMVLSGEGNIKLEKGLIAASGQIKADQGEIQYRDIDTPKLASDVHIVGKKVTPSTLNPPRLTLQLDIDLGDHFYFSGHGVSAQLGGILRLRAQNGRALNASGKVEVTEGKYRAYGQNLDIERGILSFQGNIENPALDILAMRRNQEVEAGVLVSGTALAPRVQLYSEPAVGETEKLSWLLFGHGSNNLERADAAVMLQAAQTLLSGDNSPSLLAELGIEEIGMRSVDESDGSATRVVSVTSRLGKYLRLTLEKSSNDLRDAMKLAFQAGKNWSLFVSLNNESVTTGANYTLYFE